MVTVPGLKEKGRDSRAVAGIGKESQKEAAMSSTAAFSQVTQVRSQGCGRTSYLPSIVLLSGLLVGHPSPDGTQLEPKVTEGPVAGFHKDPFPGAEGSVGIDNLKGSQERSVSLKYAFIQSAINLLR